MAECQPVDLPAPQRDSPAQVTGAARYPDDLKLPGLLATAVLRCPHAHARVKSLDVAAAEKRPGVKAVRVVRGPGSEVEWALAEVATVTAVSAAAAEDALAAVRVEYEVLPHHLEIESLESLPADLVKPGPEEKEGDPEAALAASPYKVKGRYGLRAVAANALGPDVRICRWDGAGPPVKLRPEPDADLAVGDGRPSVWAEIEAGAAEDGKLTVWVSRAWSAGGPEDGGSLSLPALFQGLQRQHRHSAVVAHTARAQVGQAPAAFFTSMVLEDLAVLLGMNPLDVLLVNLGITRCEAVCREALTAADRLMGWSRRWHARGDSGRGAVRRGLGLSLHAGGAQMADVAVDVETGVVKVRRMVGVEACGKAVEVKTAESLVSGSLAAGVSQALYEEKVIDPLTGRMLNDDSASYRRAGIGDVGELAVQVIAGSEDGRCEPSPLSAAAAVANAVANAIGLRVPGLPLTPDRVLAALEKGKTA